MVTQCLEDGFNIRSFSDYRNPILKVLHGRDSAIAEVMNAARTLTNIASLPIVAREIRSRVAILQVLSAGISIHDMTTELKRTVVVTGIAKSHRRHRRTYPLAVQSGCTI